MEVGGPEPRDGHGRLPGGSGLSAHVTRLPAVISRKRRTGFWGGRTLGSECGPS